MLLYSESINEGERNTRMTSIIGAIIAEEHDENIILARSRAANALCNPPLPDREILSIIDNIMKAEGRQKLVEVTQFIPAQIEEEKPASIASMFAPAPLRLVKAKELPPPAPEPKAEIPPCPGIVGALSSCIFEGTAASTPAFNLLASIVAVGAAVGGRVMSSSGLRTNVYGISLGYSGAGKNGPLSYLHRVCAEADCMGLLGGSTLGSGAAVLRSLEKSPRQLIMADEIGDLVKGLKSQGSYSADLPRVLKELWSATDRPYTKNYADSKKSFILTWQHLSVYACGVPEPFWSNLSIEDVADGFLARCLIVENDDPAPLPKVSFPQRIPSNIVSAFARWHSDNIDQSGDISRVPIPRMVPFRPSAQAHYDKFALQYHDMRNDNRKECGGTAAIYGRAGEHAIKLALIVECGMGEGLPDYISLEATEWACIYVKSLVDNLVAKLGGAFNVNEHDKHVKALVNFIKAREDAGKRTFRRDVAQFPFRSVLPKMRIQYIEMAKQSGAITIEPVKPPRGPATEEYKLCK